MGRSNAITSISVSEILVFNTGRGLACKKDQAIAAAAERKKDERHEEIQQSHYLVHGIPTAHFQRWVQRL
jgi:hypothetical protein